MTDVLHIEPGLRVFWEVTDDFGTSRSLLRYGLSQVGSRKPEEWEFARDELGKVHLAPEQWLAEGLSFSVTHTKNLVACAISSEGGVGIDAEFVRTIERPRPLARMFCSAGELEVLHGLPADQVNSCLLNLWTLKEAYAKAIGLGIRFSFKEISFDNMAGHRNPVPTALPPGGPSPDAWSFRVFHPTDDHICAIARLKPRQRWLSILPGVRTAPAELSPQRSGLTLKPPRKAAPHKAQRGLTETGLTGSKPTALMPNGHCLR